MPKLTINPDAKIVHARKGESILRAVTGARIFLSQKCGGNASCTTCRIRLLTPASFTAPNPREKRRLTEEQLDQHIRLACQTLILSDGKVERLPSQINTIIITRIKEDDGN